MEACTLVQMMAKRMDVTLFIGMFIGEISRNNILDEDGMQKVFAFGHELANQASKLSSSLDNQSEN